MTSQSLLLITSFVAVLLVLSWPLGRMIDAVMNGRFKWGKYIEQPVYRLLGINPETETGWVSYCIGLVIFNVLGVIAVFLIQRLQLFLPFNPQDMVNISVDSSVNTAISFVTNTNWQGYGGETTMSYFTQMTALTVQNFLSAATGIVVVIALIRGFVRRSAKTIGNVWVDLTRTTLWILIPLSAIFALLLASQGVIQNLSPYTEVQTIETQTWQEPVKDLNGEIVLDKEGQPELEAKSSTTQTLAMGPVASQLSIKLLGTNGGGFFNTNSAHPFENPTPLANFMEMLCIFLIPAALCFTFGNMVADKRQGFAIFSAMFVMFIIFALGVTYFEQMGNPHFSTLGVDQLSSVAQAGGNMEGKEVRFGISASSLFAAITTGASCGAVNAMLDSFTPLGGAVPLILMQLGEVVFGGVGTGLYNMLVFAIMAVFIAGLMIGRTPEYLSKKIEVFDMKMASIAILITPIVVLCGTALATMTEAGRAGILNPGPHGFSEILYAFTSAANNNGSAFAGLSVNTPFYNYTLAVVMWLGRFGGIIPVLAIAGSMAAKKRIAVTEGTLPTHGPLFVTLLIITVLLIGLLNYVPSLALGPVVEHLMLWAN
ncbi:potassium-transporting ATPase subunit KdpA [Oxalobacter paraformigenes]|uniref:Potassium-transporting ATPase potassium-binding subunit n=1 Tax=Oxalobacter paraformigenes TaxID=556268 RepID=C3X645_9BURK|nr:potassium-transporting ATPase subunit KdpA [Oxalobacter paraformigenes]EEO28681.1 K+-transporting ATPase, A subunit [Oxalobacter paraformigenes]